ncbi:MAG: hypothetical protein AAF632_05865 [Bacteroidota bacterium]
MENNSANLPFANNQPWQDDYQSAFLAYREYVSLAHIAYQNEPDVLYALRIDRPSASEATDWLQQARYFYTQIPAYNDLLNQKFGLKPEVWAQALMEIHALLDLENSELLSE